MRLPQFQAHAACEDVHWWFTARRAILMALLREVLPPSPATLVVDVGCGTGANTAAVARDYDCLGIDPQEEAIAFARARFPHVRFRQGFAPQDIPEEMKRAGAVLLMDVLEHIEHDAAFIRDLVSAMRPGAFLFVMAPADPSLWAPHDAGFEHFRRYDLEGFRALWKELPVRERLVSPCNARLYPLIKLLRRISRLRGKVWGQGDSDIAIPSWPVNLLLRKIFLSELPVLRGVLSKKRKRGLRKGVSVFAILEIIAPSPPASPSAPRP